MGIHSTEAKRECIEILRDRLSCCLERGLLLLEVATPDVDLGLRIRDAELGRCLETCVEKAAAKHECQRENAEPYASGPETNMPKVALALRQKDQLHENPPIARV